MSRWTQVTATSPSIPAGASEVVNISVSQASINIGLLQVTPSVAGGTTTIWICKKATCLSGDIVFTDYADNRNVIYFPVFLPAGVAAEADEGFVAYFEDLDATPAIHLRIFNNGLVAKTFAIVINYESVGVSLGAWADVANPTTMLTGGGGMTVSFSGGTMLYRKKYLDSKTLLIYFAASIITLGGSAGSVLLLRLPDGASTKGDIAAAVYAYDDTAFVLCQLYSRTGGSVSQLSIGKLTGANWVLGTAYVRGELFVELA